MDLFFKSVGFLLVLLMMVVFYRVIKGPTVIDRLVGVNVIGTKATVLLIIMGIIFKRVDMFVDIAIAYGLLNFIASISAAKFYQHHKTLHPEAQWENETKKV
jgi:multicomponent Na+:H+ antiporter subunit F